MNKTILWFCAAAAALATFQPFFAASASAQPGQRTETVPKAMCEVEVRRKSPSEDAWVFGHSGYTGALVATGARGSFVLCIYDSRDTVASTMPLHLHARENHTSIGCAYDGRANDLVFATGYPPVPRPVSSVVNRWRIRRTWLLDPASGRPKAVASSRVRCDYLDSMDEEQP